MQSLILHLLNPPSLNSPGFHIILTCDAPNKIVSLQKVTAREACVRSRGSAKANDEVGKPASFPEPAFPLAGGSLAFCCFASRGNAVKSFVRMRNAAWAYRPPFSLARVAPSRSLFISAESQRAMQSFAILLIAKFRQLARSFRRIFRKKIALRCEQGLRGRGIRSVRFICKRVASEADAIFGAHL